MCFCNFHLNIIIFGSGEKYAEVNDIGELADIDFLSNIACVYPSYFEWYPDSFYSPEAFASRELQASETPDDGARQYGTYRIILALEPGTVYGVSGYSNTFAQTLWIDGVIMARAGAPGTSAETTKPGILYYTVYFTAIEKTEIVIQWANFVHNESGIPYEIFIGEQRQITLMSVRLFIRASFMVGCTLIAGLFIFGIYLFFRERRHFLWYSLSCLMMAARTLLRTCLQSFQ